MGGWFIHQNLLHAEKELILNCQPLPVRGFFVSAKLFCRNPWTLPNIFVYLQCLKISRYDMPHLRKRVRLLYRYMLIIILYYIELLHRVGNRKLSRRFAKALDNP